MHKHALTILQRCFTTVTFWLPAVTTIAVNLTAPNCSDACQRQRAKQELFRPLLLFLKQLAQPREVDRLWKEGDDLDALRQTPIEYTRKANRVREPLIQPSLSLGRTVNKLGIRRLIRQGFRRRIIEKISRREPVKASTYRDYERRIEEYARRRQRAKHSVS